MAKVLSDEEISNLLGIVDDIETEDEKYANRLEEEILSCIKLDKNKFFNNKILYTLVRNLMCVYTRAVMSKTGACYHYIETIKDFDDKHMILLLNEQYEPRVICLEDFFEKFNPTEDLKKQIDLSLV